MQCFSAFTEARYKEARRKYGVRERQRCKMVPIWEKYTSGTMERRPRFLKQARLKRSSPDAVAVMTPHEIDCYRQLDDAAEFARRVNGSESLADHPPTAGNTQIYTSQLGALEDASVDGMDCLRELQRSLEKLDNCGWLRTEHQVMFHRVFVNACLRKFMGNDFFQYANELRREFDLNDTRNFTLLLTPRRFGKTTSVAMFAAAALYSQKNVIIAIYSTGKRASGKLLEMIVQMYLQLCDGDTSSINVHNSENFAVTSPFNGAVNVVNSYPESAKIDLYCFPCQTTPHTRFENACMRVRVLFFWHDSLVCARARVF